MSTCIQLDNLVCFYNDDNIYTVIDMQDPDILTIKNIITSQVTNTPISSVYRIQEDIWTDMLRDANMLIDHAKSDIKDFEEVKVLLFNASHNKSHIT